VADSIDDAGERVINQIRLVAASAQVGYSTAVENDPQRWKYFSAGVIVAGFLVIIGAVIARHLGA
jgi:hypothetical protein